MATEQKTPQNPKREAHLLFWWLIIFSGLIAWNFISYRATPVTHVELPYSTFLAQVRQGNVVSVQIIGEKINGSFSQALLWPEITPTVALTGQAEPAAPQAYSEFVTTFPETIGDPNLIALLEQQGIEVSVQSRPNPWVITLLLQGLPFLLLIAFFIWMARQASRSQTGMFGFGRSQARRYSRDYPEVTFDDVAGADEAKIDLQEVVDFLRHPQKYHQLGARIPRGVLLVGPPGTGKTLLGRAVAGEAGVPFFSLSGSEFVEMFVGVGASRVRDLFAQAKTAAPAIVFIDELDAVGRRRGTGMGTVNDEREQTLNQLLVEMDGFDERQEVIILSATNRPDVLDPALLRPGRFDRQVVVGLPDLNGRADILRIHTRSLNLAADVDLAVLARKTTGFSGADLANLSNEAALIAARHNHSQIAMADFEEAQDKVLLGGARSLLLSEPDRRIVAYHEAGHALVAWLTPAADPVHKVTIIPRGRALGMTEQLPLEDRYNYSRTYLLARLAVMLAGRTAEEIVIGDVTTGAENDLIEATRLARGMVTRWAMSEVGLAAFATNEDQPFLGYTLAQGQRYSETTAARIDQAVENLLEASHETVHRLLSDSRDLLERLAMALLAKESIDQEQLGQLLGPRPEQPALAVEPALPRPTSPLRLRPSSGSGSVSGHSLRGGGA
jgi:cell division protease FtsH